MINVLVVVHLALPFFDFLRDTESEVSTHMENLLLNQQWESMASTVNPAY